VVGNEMKRLLLKICKNEKGMTIPELLIAIGIMTITLAGAFSLMQLSENSWKSTTTRMNARDEASLKMNQIATTIRNAEDPDDVKGLLDTADDDNIVFYANTDADDQLEKIQYQQAGTNLTRTITQPSGVTKPWVYTGAIESTTVANNLENNASNPLFTYYISGASVTVPASSGDRPQINEVGLNLKTLTANGNKSEHITLGTRIFLRNLR
jgi:prepilin-type N-terminal cleavage/methylation domain-containing protein